LIKPAQQVYSRLFSKAKIYRQRSNFLAYIAAQLAAGALAAFVFRFLNPEDK